MSLTPLYPMGSRTLSSAASRRRPCRSNSQAAGKQAQACNKAGSVKRVHKRIPGREARLEVVHHRHRRLRVQLSGPLKGLRKDRIISPSDVRARGKHASVRIVSLPKQGLRKSVHHTTQFVFGLTARLLL